MIPLLAVEQPMIVSGIPAYIVAAASVLGALLSYINGRSIKEQTHVTNSKMDLLIETVGAAEYAKGRKSVLDEQAANAEQQEKGAQKEKNEKARTQFIPTPPNQ